MEIVAASGVPVVLNTSFNENEPIVNTPEQAVDCFLRTHMDILAIGSYVARKAVRADVRAPRREAAAIRA